MIRIETDKDGSVHIQVNGQELAVPPPGMTVVLTEKTLYEPHLEYTDDKEST